MTATVLKEVEEYLKDKDVNGPFDLNSASKTYKNIDMVCGKKPQCCKGIYRKELWEQNWKAPFTNVRKCIVNGVQKTSVNHALMYEKF